MYSLYEANMLRIPQDRIQQPVPLRPPVMQRQPNHPSLEIDTAPLRADIQNLRDISEANRTKLQQLHADIRETDMVHLLEKSEIEARLGVLEQSTADHSKSILSLKHMVEKWAEWLDHMPIQQSYTKRLHLHGTGSSDVPDIPFLIQRQNDFVRISCTQSIQFTPTASGMLQFGPLPPEFRLGMHFIIAGVLDMTSTIRHSIGLHVDADGRMSFYRIGCTGPFFARGSPITIFPFSVGGPLVNNTGD